MKRRNQSYFHESFRDTVDLIKNYAIFTLDKNGHITSWNEGGEKINGWKEDEVIGRYFDFLYPNDDRKKNLPKKNLEEAVKKGVHEEEELRIKKDNTLFLADITITPVYDEKTGKHTGFIKIVKDITKRKKEEADQIDANLLLKKEIERRKKIEDALKMSNEELDAFASAASHDLQEPLRMVVSYLQLIERRYAKVFDADGLDFMGFAIDGATRMKTLINDLVEYSRIETFGKPFTQNDVTEVVRRAIANLEVMIKENHAQITYDKLPDVLSDNVQLTRVFQNLLVNAIKFRKDDDPRIHVGVSENNDEYIFSVRDNGKGIEEKYFKNIFVIFKQLAKRAERTGSGIGLAISKKIISRHNGIIWVESQVGIGSIFYFTIPKKMRKEEKDE